MRKWRQTILILITWATIASGQNLVPNPSFETFSSCPNNFSQINRATPWFDPTGATSDYYNACDTGYMNVPNCGIYGYQPARTGVAYAGLWALNGFGDGSREYVRVQFTTSLQADSCYYIEFYCNLDNHTGYTIKTLAAYIGNGGTSTSTIPQIISNTFLTDTLNWMKISGYYQANGGEQYITIGNFKPYASGDTLNTGIGTYPGSYYNIDDVTVIRINGCDTVGVGIRENVNAPFFKLYPNPTNQSATLEFNNPTKLNCTLTLYDLHGQIVRTVKNITTDKVEIERQNLIDGLYFFQLRTDRKIVATGKLKIEQ